MNHPEIIIPLVSGVVLDAIFGDPYGFPHPIRAFGRIIHLGDQKFNSGKYKRIKGVVLSLALVFAVWSFFLFLLKSVSNYSIVFYVLSSVFVFYAMASHSLIKESVKVILMLEKKGIEAARKQLSSLVGRDTANLSEQEIRTAVLETMAENLSDGVIAPLFWYFIGGVPFMFAYKMINTLDSMIGYKNEKYREFGWFAAKLDDVANFIPARLTAFFMVLVAFSPRGLIFIFKYGHKHSSPNSGYPEAALAGILNCRFGGPDVYHGVRVNKPYIGNHSKTISNRDLYIAGTIHVFVSISIISAFIVSIRYI